MAKHGRDMSSSSN